MGNEEDEGGMTAAGERETCAASPLVLLVLLR
jgi:hypothetical protein